MHSRISVNSACFMQSGLQEQATYWAALAARQVSLISSLIEKEGVDAVAAVLRSGAHQVESIVHPFLAGAAFSERGDWSLPRQRLSAQIDAANQLGAKSIYLITGGHGDLVWEDAAQVFAEAISPCLAQANDCGINLLVENSSPQYADIHLAHTLRDTLTLANFAGTGVCIDLFACWAEADLKSLLSQAVPVCSLVQVSDYVCGDRALPARAVVGDGNIPLSRLLGWIVEAGYGGSFDLELLGPRIDAEGQVNATRRSAENLGAMLEAMGVHST